MHSFGVQRQNLTLLGLLFKESLGKSVFGESDQKMQWLYL